MYVEIKENEFEKCLRGTGRVVVKTGWCFWPGCASLQYAFGVGACV